MRNTRERGSILRFLLILVIAFFLASYYFDFSLRDVMESPRVRENIAYVRENAKPLYDKYLKDFLKERGNEAFEFVRGYLWTAFTGGLSDLKNHRPTVFERNAPRLDLGGVDEEATALGDVSQEEGSASDSE